MASSPLLVLLLVAILGLAHGHSYVTKPRPRNGQQGGCRIGGPPEYPQNCPGPCEVNKYSANQPRTNVERGQVVPVEWPRNNHGGGFIRLAFIEASKTELPNAHQLFDGNVAQYSCHEVGCQADAGPGNTGGDSNGQDGTKNPCRTTVTIPLHLTDGVWTMQWSWYGSGGGYLGDYYSCVNFQVAGGPTGPQVAPVFKGGDVSPQSGNDKCKYWSTDRLHYCVSEPCSDICSPNTSPVGACNYPPRYGAPYIDPLITPTQTSNTQPTTPATTGPPPVVTTGSNPDTPVIEVIVTVQLSMGPEVFDPVVFIYDITDLLELPVAAVRKVEVNLDRSTSQTTVITFHIVNVVDREGNPVNPVQAAIELKKIAESNDPRIGRYNLQGLTVLDADVSSSASSIAVCFALIAVLLALWV